MKMMLAALMLASAAPNAAAAPQNETAQAFLERTYAAYVQDAPRSLDYLDALYAPELAAEIRRDAELAGGEVGHLNGDPLCDCQDVTGMKPRIESVTASGDATAEARVVMDPGTSNSREVTLRLVLTSDGWRVADVNTKEEPSLLDALRRSNGGQ